MSKPTTNIDTVATNMEKEISLNYEKMGPCKQKITAEIPSSHIEKLKKSVMNYVKANANVPGFRKGKVPLKVLSAKYKDVIDSELTHFLLKSVSSKILNENKFDYTDLDVADSKQLEIPDKVDEKEKFVIIFYGDTIPQFELPDYKNISVEKPQMPEITEEEIEEHINSLKELYGSFKTVDNENEKIQSGDICQITYSCNMKVDEDGDVNLKHFLSGEDEWIWLNDKFSFIPGIKEVLLEHKLGDEFDFEADYPTDFKTKELAGKKLTYKIKITKLQRRYPVESDEKLCEILKAENIDELKTDIKAQFERENRSEYENKLRERILNAIVKETENFEVPEKFLNKEKELILQNILDREKQAGKSDKEIEEAKKKYEEEASERAYKNLKEMYIIRLIGKKENLEVEDKEIDMLIKYFSHQHGITKKHLKERMTQNGEIDLLRYKISVNKVLSFLVKNVKIEEVKNNDK